MDTHNAAGSGRYPASIKPSSVYGRDRFQPGDIAVVNGQNEEGHKGLPEGKFRRGVGAEVEKKTERTPDLPRYAVYISTISLLVLFLPALGKTQTLAPATCQQFVSASGIPLAGGFLYSHVASTSTPTPTYADSAVSITNSNPIILNAGGYPVSATGGCGIWLNNTITYKFVLQNSTHTAQWTVDNITAFDLVTLLSQANTWTMLQTFSAGITGTGNIGTLGLGSTALGANNSWSGNDTFTGNVTAAVGQNIFAAYNFNNRIMVDGCVSTVPSPKYANTSAGINSAISAAIALGGGVVDATACATLSTYNSEIDVGNSSGVPVILLLPAGNSGGTPSWVANITDGVSFGIKVFNNSSVIGYGPGLGAPFQITAGGNLGAVCGNDTSVANAHIRMEGFTCSVYGGAPAIAKAIGYFSGLGDNSLVQNMTFIGLSPTEVLRKVLWVNNSCCKTVFNNINADAFSISGVTPCFFGNGTTGPNLTIAFHGSCTHPGNGASNIVDQEWNQYGTNTFTAYMEAGTYTDTTTPKVSIQAFGSPTAADIFIGTNAAGDVASSTRYVFDIASGAHAIIIGAEQGTVSTNAVNDHNSGGAVFTRAVNSVFSYSTEPSWFGAGAAFNAATLTGLTNGTGLQIFNTTTTCTTAASAGATCTTSAISLPVAEADTNYRVVCTGKGITNVPVVIATTNSSSSQFTITIAAITAAAATFTSYDCVAGHN